MAGSAGRESYISEITAPPSPKQSVAPAHAEPGEVPAGAGGVQCRRLGTDAGQELLSLGRTQGRGLSPPR